MNFNDITSRVTGFSIPIFGVSWTPPPSERSVARRVIAFLEDRRVLFNPDELEVPEHCVQSIIEIRHHLTGELQQLHDDHEISKHLAAMRAACRKFLDTVQADDRVEIVRFGNYGGHYASWIFMSALGEMRGVFGIHIAQLAASYGLDVEDELARILPVGDDGGDDDGLSDQKARRSPMHRTGRK